jgi:ketosteroid isomerase-like protein
MSQENVEVIRRLYGLWPDRISAAEEVLHPDVAMDIASRNVITPGLYRGFDGFRRFLERVEEVWENLQVEPEELIDAGDNVVAAVRMSGKRRGTKVKTDTRVFTVWTFREGKVWRYTSYGTKRQALEAVGLSE